MNNLPSFVFVSDVTSFCNVRTIGTVVHECMDVYTHLISKSGMDKSTHLLGGIYIQLSCV